MSEENKDGCCKPGSSCWSPKKMILAVLFGAFMFMAGMMFSKTFCGSGGMCPMSTAR